MRRKLGLGALMGMICASQPAMSQGFDSIVSDSIATIGSLADTLTPDGFTNLRLGVGAVVSPDYIGADGYGVSPLPLVSFRFRDIVSVDNNKVKVHVLSRRSLFGSEHFKAGPVINLDFGRDTSDSADLIGLNEVGFGVEMGGHVSYTWSSFRASLEIRQDVAGGHDGFLLEGGLNVAIFQSDSLTVGGGVTTTFASNKYMDSYFSVTAAESVASGLAVYDAGSGIRDISTGLAANFRLTEEWAVVTNMGYRRLLGDASDNPLVADRGSSNQFSAGAFVVYTF